MKLIYVQVVDPATRMSVTYWNVPAEQENEYRDRAKADLEWRKNQLSVIPLRIVA